MSNRATPLGRKELNLNIKVACQCSTGSIYDYLNKGDIVSEDIVDNFMDMLPPRAMSYGYLQVGEPFNYVYDIEHRLRPTYVTFAKCNGQWMYYGNCFH